MKTLLEQAFSVNQLNKRSNYSRGSGGVDDEIAIILSDYDYGVEFSSFKNLSPQDKENLLKKDKNSLSSLFEHFLKTPSCRKAIALYTDCFIRFAQTCLMPPDELIKTLRHVDCCEKEELLNYLQNKDLNINFIRDSQGNDIGVEMEFKIQPSIKEGFELRYDYRYRYFFNYTEKSDCVFKNSSNIKSVVVAQEDTGEFLPVNQFLKRDLQIFPGEEFWKRICISKTDNGQVTCLQFDFHICDSTKAVFLSPLESNKFSVVASDLEGKEFKRFISQDDLVAQLKNDAPFSRQYLTFESKVAR